MWSDVPGSMLLMAVAGLAMAGSADALRRSLLPVLSYEDFVENFGLKAIRRAEAPERLAQRKATFQKHLTEVIEHNSRTNRTWKAAINHLSDLTDDETKSLMGYHRIWERRTASVSFASARESSVNSSKVFVPLPDEIDWRMLKTSERILEQGSCGSCWAIASVGALEAHAEIGRRHVQPLSFEQLLRCVPNPKQCGGSGGCGGATSELAFDWVRLNGLSTDDDFSFRRTTGEGDFCSLSSQGPRIVVDGFERLPVNQALPLMCAVAEKGPVVVSADATPWRMYAGGVFDNCGRDAVVNHAVLLMGYGQAPEGKFWLIRNSWGRSWGERGFIRLLRHDEDGAYCGVDRRPQEGVYCDDAPQEVPVCGMCGVTADSSYPIGVRVLEPGPRQKSMLRHQGYGSIALYPGA